MAPGFTVPSASLVVRELGGEPIYEAKFRYEGRQVKRRIGPAWLTRDPSSGAWRPRRGRVAEGAFDERRAHAAAAELVTRYVEETVNAERVASERQARGVTFREIAHAYLDWLEHVRGAKPSTIRSHRSDLAEPGRLTAAAPAPPPGSSWPPWATARPGR